MPIVKLIIGRCKRIVHKVLGGIRYDTCDAIRYKPITKELPTPKLIFKVSIQIVVTET